MVAGRERRGPWSRRLGSTPHGHDEEQPIDNPVNQGPLVKLHANDHVVAVNNWGSYAFAHLDPGDYLLASEIKGTASTLRISLEAGKTYYFLEDIVNDDAAVLSRHTKELVMHQVTGARYADWKKKNGGS